MATARRMLALGALAVSLAACGSAGGVNPTPNWTYGPTPSPPADGRQAFSTLGLRFTYPATWHRGEFEVTSSFSNVLVYLSTEPLSDPCDRSPAMIACTREAVAALRPSGLLVTWTHKGWPGWSFDPGAGTGATVGGQTATVAELTADDNCRMIGGERLVIATIPTPDAAWNWDEMRACLRGPDVAGSRAAVQAMLDSVRWQ